VFEGIVESLGEITNINLDQGNVGFSVKSDISNELKIDQSVSHSGVCLTVVDINNGSHTVTAVKETLDKSSLKNFKLGDSINLERAMKLGDRLDGHMVQGHVDGVAKCLEVNLNQGSWVYKFEFDKSNESLLIEKGSVCINGVSLTVFNIVDNKFDVTIIPYTYENTSFKELKKEDLVNIEFDMIGKYLSRFETLKNNN
jgi:riboflavin synthase